MGNGWTTLHLRGRSSATRTSAIYIRTIVYRIADLLIFGLRVGALGGAFTPLTGVSQSVWPSLGVSWACASLVVLVGWKLEFWRLSRTSPNLPWEALSRAERGSESGPVWTRLRLVQNSHFIPLGGFESS